SERRPTRRCSGGRAAPFSCLLVRRFAAPLNAVCWAPFPPPLTGAMLLPDASLGSYPFLVRQPHHPRSHRRMRRQASPGGQPLMARARLSIASMALATGAAEPLGACGRAEKPQCLCLTGDASSEQAIANGESRRRRGVAAAGQE